MLIMRCLIETDCIQTKASLLKKDLKKSKSQKQAFARGTQSYQKLYTHTEDKGQYNGLFLILEIQLFGSCIK